MSRAAPVARRSFRYFLPIQTRWKDNDQYGHLNNVIAYEMFDTVVNKFLMDHCRFGSPGFPVIGFVVNTTCSYYRPMSYPDVITAALAVDRIGTSSVTFHVGLFPSDNGNVSADAKPAAAGSFTHAYVSRESQQPVRPLPTDFVAALEKFTVLHADQNNSLLGSRL